MNLKKERLAFEKWCVSEGYECTDEMLASWLAAKVHAAVMACPLAEVRKRKDNHQWAVYVPTSLTAVAYDFPHKEAAVTWAVNHGYRVEI